MEPAALSGCQREIFFDRHAGRAAAHGVLKETSDLLGALVLGGEGDVCTVQRDFSESVMKLPAMAPKSVDLPAPFAPMIEMKSPGRT